jgi:hypothetical protein
MVFAACGALFHLANASMLGLVSQKLALQNVGQGIALTAASAIAAQSVMVPWRLWPGRGRMPGGASRCFWLLLWHWRCARYSKLFPTTRPG